MYGGGGMMQDPPASLLGDGAGRSPLDHACRMDSAPTPAECRLWQGLRSYRVAGLKFRRQMPLGPYSADFYRAVARVVGEVDGISHIDALTDGIRDTWIQQHGVHVFRVSNHDLLSNVEGMRLAIQQAAVALPPNTLPQGEGES